MELSIGNVVSYLFGNSKQYKIVASINEPIKRLNNSDLAVNEGFDYVIVKYPLMANEFGAYLHVSKEHLVFIAMD